MKKNRNKIFLVGILLLVAVVPMALAMNDKNTLVDVTISVNSEGPYAGSFDTLIAAVLAADPVVVERLNGLGQTTVFAPTDDAFAKLGLNENNIASLPKETLTDILLYHVAKGRRDAENVIDSEKIRTLNKQFIYQDDGILTDQKGSTSNIIVTDVAADNGIIHVIDSVLMPR